MGNTLLEEKGSEPMESVEEVRRKNKEKESRFGKRYRFEIKLRCVKLHLEEGLPISLLSKEVGASTDGIRRWVKAYQERGEVGLQNPVRSSGRWRRLAGPVRKLSGKITDLGRKTQRNQMGPRSGTLVTPFSSRTFLIDGPSALNFRSNPLPFSTSLIEPSNVIVDPPTLTVTFIGQGLSGIIKAPMGPVVPCISRGCPLNVPFRLKSVAFSPRGIDAVRPSIIME